MSNDASSVLAKARAEIGYCRWDDPAAGTKYGRWYATDHGSYYGVNGVPFCAMFVSWVFAQAGARCAGLPEAYCPYILNDARAAGAVLADKTKAQPGDVVLFDWDGGVVDHVGIVESNHGSYVQTIEGNTTINGRSGSVGRRTRAWSTVEAVVRPSWGSSGGPQASGGKIAVDGYWGPKTTLLAHLRVLLSRAAEAGQGLEVLDIPQELPVEARGAGVERVSALPPADRGRVLSTVAQLNSDPDRIL